MKKNLTILIAEDEAIVRLSLERELKKLYCTVIGANDGSEARDIIEKENIDVLITDINMPTVNGFGTGSDLIEYVMSKKHIKVIPIVIMSAYSDLLCNYEGIECISIVKKPIIDIGKIYNKIEEMIVKKETDCDDDVFKKLRIANDLVKVAIELIKKG